MYNSISRLDSDLCGFAGKEDIFSKKLLEALEIWYARFPPSKKRGRSLLAARPRVSVGGAQLDDP